jgi:hypothetical protein
VEDNFGGTAFWEMIPSNAATLLFKTFSDFSFQPLLAPGALGSGRERQVAPSGMARTLKFCRAPGHLDDMAQTVKVDFDLLGWGRILRRIFATHARPEQPGRAQTASMF